LKKIFAAAICIVLLASFALLSGRAENNPPKGAASDSTAIHVDVDIGERFFMEQMNDIFLNINDYLGKVIKFEGAFGIFESRGSTFYSVFRPGPACCADDVTIGLNVIWDGEYPKNEEWVEAIGVLESYKVNEFNAYRLNLSSLTVIPKQ